MMLSMNDLSVQDNELLDSQSTLGFIDVDSDNMVGNVLSAIHMSGISMMSMTNNSTDSLFQSKSLDSSSFSDSTQNASWDGDAVVGGSFNHSVTSKSTSIVTLAANLLRQ